MKKKLNQAGLVSIIVTMIMMIVISLVVLGFARLAKREQRQTLDSQLSTQAFYAAESGVNDAVGELRAASAAGSPITTDYTSNCTQFIQDRGLTNQLDGANVQYSCLLVDPSPVALRYTIGKDATVVPVRVSSGNVGSVKLEWQDTTGSNSLSSCPPLGEFRAAASWPAACNAGVLRVDIVPTNGTLSRDGLLNSQFTVFLMPQNAPGSGVLTYSVPPSTDSRGRVWGGSCSTGSSPMCSTIINLSSLASNSFYLRVRSVYADNTLAVSTYATNNGTGVASEMVGAQALVDVTGKAAEVLRRMAIYVDISNIGNGVPSFAIQSKEDICKKFTVATGLAPTDEGGVACPSF